MSRQLLTFAQVLLCMDLVLGQQVTGTFGIGGFQPIFQEIKGLPSNQHGFVITQPNYQKFDSRVITQEQQIQLKAQEAFRKAVEETNRARIKDGILRPFPESQSVEIQSKLVRENSINNSELESQQLPKEEGLIQQSASERFESFRSPPAEIIAEMPSNSNFNEDISLKSQYDAKVLREQAENAHYSFKSAVADSINDHSHIRQEIREGLKLKGLYSYSDGYFKRTVHYVADENGYRVISEENEPIGTGPQINPLGQADVSSQIAGKSLEYTIKGEDLPSPVHNKSIIIN